MFGETVAILRADLAQYEKDLNRAEQMYRQHLQRLRTQTLGMGSIFGSSGGGGRGSSSGSRGGDPLGFSHIGAMGDPQRHVRAAEAAERKFRVVMSSAETERRRFYSSWDNAIKENERRQIESAKRVAAAQKQAQVDALRFFRQAAGARAGFAGVGAGGPGAFLTPEHLRVLDSANAKWLKKQQLIAQAGGMTGILQKRMDEIGRNQLARMNAGATSFVNTLKFLTVGGAAGILTGLVGAGIRANMEFEQQQVTLATILGISDKIVDSRGKELDKAQQLTLNLAEAEKLYARIRKEAAGSILTGKELFAATAANFGLGRAAGLNPEQIIQVTKLITQLAKSQGLEGEGLLAQETRALFTGEGLESATVARMLGINRMSQIKGAQDKGDFFGFIMNKLREGLPAIEQYGKSFKAFTTTLQTAFQDLTRLSFEKVFDKITDRLGNFTKMITQERIDEWAEKISDALLETYDALERFANSDGWRTLQKFFQFVVDNARTIITVFAAFKAAQVVGAGAAGLRGLAASGLGGAIAAQSPGLAAGLVGTAGALSAGAAFVAGGGIGLAINDRFIGVNERAEAATEAETRRRFPLAARRAQLRRNIAEIETEVGKAEFVERDPRQAAVQRRLLEREKARLASIESQIAEQQDTRFADRTAEALGLGSGADLIRESRAAPRKDLERRQKLNEERIEFAQHMAKLSGDKIRQLKADAEAEKLEVEKNFKDTAMSAERRAALLKAIEQKLVRDVAIIREEQRLSVARQFAEMTEDRRRLLAIEFRETLLNIKKENLAREDEIALRLAAESEYQRKFRDLRSEERLERQKFVADAMDNEVLQIINAANRAYKERKSFLEKTVKDQKQLEAEVNRSRVMLFDQANRKIIEKQNELYRKALDLARESQEFQNRLHKARLNMEKDILEAQKRLAKETRDLMRDRIQAEKDLKRAQEDRLRKVREVGTGADMVGGLVRTGRFAVNPLNRGLEGQLGLRGVDMAIQQEADNLFASEELRTQLADRFRRETGNPELAQAMAERQVREFASQAGQAGGTESIMGRLGELGIRTGGDFRSRLQGLETRGLEVENTRAQIERETGMSELERERQDINEQVEEARRRLQELDERQAEVLQSYKDTITNLHDTFDLQVKETASQLADLAREANEVANAFKANQMPVPSNIVPVVRDLSRFSPQRAQTEAESRLSETGSFIFNEGAIRIDAAGMDPDKLLETITKAAQDLSRRTAPSRR